MNDADKLIAKLVATCVCVFFLTVGSCTSYQNHDDNSAIVELVKAGANPLAAKCAIRQDTSTCAAMSAK